MSYFVEIIKPDSTLYKGNVKLLRLPGSEGSFEILKNHAPLISTLKKGEIKVVSDKKEEKFFNIQGGVIEVINNKVLILVE